MVGLALLFATIIIPAADNTRLAQRESAQAQAQADHQSRRVARYWEYLDALDRQDPTLYASLAADQLNLTPTDARIISFEDPETRARRPIDVFERIEPPPMIVQEEYQPVDSLLGKLARGERSRLVLLAGAAISLMFGLLPAARARRS